MPATAAAAPAQAPEPLEAVPAKPEHKIGQLTTGELARERSRLEAALRRPFSADVKALLRTKLDAVLEEQAGTATLPFREGVPSQGQTPVSGHRSPS